MNARSTLAARLDPASPGPPAAPAASSSASPGPGRPRAASRAASAGALVMTLLGVALFAYTIRQAGVEATMASMRRVGLGGFAAILALSGLRLAVRALAWARCVEGERRLSLWQAFEATLIGEALGNMTPFGTFISEPSKAVLVRRAVPLGPALSAIAVENIFYAFTVNIVIAVGTLAFLLNYHVGGALQRGSIAALLAVGLLVGVGLAIILRGATPLTMVLGRVARHGPHGWRERLAALTARLHGFESRIYSFYGRNRHRLLPLLALETIFHLAGIAEVYLTLALVSASPAVTLLAALVLESTGRVINVLFKFIPFRLGVDEAGAAVVAGVMGLTSAAGVTLAVVRKARILCWTAAGVLLLARRGLTVRAVVREVARDRQAATPDPTRPWNA